MNTRDVQTLRNAGYDVSQILRITVSEIFDRHLRAFLDQVGFRST